MTQAPKYKRSARNYLIDPKFQLKYTGLLVAITVVLALALGALLWRTSSQVVAQSQNTVEQGKQTVEQGLEAVKQGQETVSRGKQVIDQSRKVSQVVAMNIEKNYGDQPELAKTFKADADSDDAKLIEEQKRLETDAEFLTKHSADLKQQSTELEQQAKAVQDGQRNLFIGLVGAMVALVVGIGIAGIVFTHKIAGPIFKMKRLMREVAAGKLVLREKLRKGDELQHFFESFEQMVETMRGHQRKEIARVDGIVETLQTDNAAGLEKLKELRKDMQDHLEA